MAKAQGEELSHLDFGAMIGGPLSAVVKAQAQSALTTADFIKEVGFNKGSDGNLGDAINVDFVYEKPMPDGSSRAAKLSVPILTILPIPFIQIEYASISFNAKLLGTTHHNLLDTGNQSVTSDIKSGPFMNWYARADLKASMTHQHTTRSGANTKDRYSLAVNVQAVQADIPAGMDKVLNILESLVQENESKAGSIRSVIVKSGGGDGALFKVGTVYALEGGSGSNATVKMLEVESDGKAKAVSVVNWGEGYKDGDYTIKGADDKVATLTVTAMP